MSAGTSRIETQLQRPVTAKLVVHTETGEQWDATPQDLKNFGYGNCFDLYIRAHDMLLEALGLLDDDDLSDAANAVRYLMECAISYDHSPWARADGSPWDADEDGEDIRKLIQEALR